MRTGRQAKREEGGCIGWERGHGVKTGRKVDAWSKKIFKQPVLDGSRVAERNKGRGADMAKST